VKIFLIVIAMMSSNAHTDLFVISTPTFKDPRTCIEFVKINNITLIQKAKIEYPDQGIDNIYCISKEKLKNYVSGTEA
jgi:hypothetical protein|tara:strand:- start:260 stop:493 length:234 start_codon:yes stop_codon:yes gene_type:complete